MIHRSALQERGVIATTARQIWTNSKQHVKFIGVWITIENKTEPTMGPQRDLNFLESRIEMQSLATIRPQRDSDFLGSEVEM